MGRRLIRRVEHAGEWWAQRRDGRWLRWDVDVNDWLGPQAPPFEAADTNAAGRARGAPLTDEPLNPLDRWWNRRFPPNSAARLLFLLLALPVVAGFHALVRHLLGMDVSLGQYLFVWIVGSVLLSFWWVSGESKRGTTVASKPSLPDGVPHPPVPRPDGDATIVAEPPATYRPTLRDFMVGIPFGFAGAVALEWAAGGADAFTRSNLLSSLAGGIAVSAIIVLRYTVWGLLLFSALVGAGGAIFLQLFLLFSAHEPSFLEAWLIASLSALAFAAPFWWALRSRRLGRRHPRSERLPAPWPVPVPQDAPPGPRMWVAMTGVLIMLIGAAVVFRLTGGN